jgi:two-component system, OmpR family, alkaline phosphatase synthesis response regulator PhoP
MMSSAEMPRILLVEDEPSILNLVFMNLTARGYQVVTAMSGGEALEHLDEEEPKLMILDLRLPDMSGWAILERMYDNPFFPPDFPVVIMTASVMDPNFVINEYPCVTEVLTKPFDINGLMLTVQDVLSKN